MALVGAVNSLTLQLTQRMTHSIEKQSPFYQTVITLVGLTAGALIAPHVIPKFLKNQAVVLTTDVAFRIAACNLATKVALYSTFKMGILLYNKLTFPAFKDFKKMPPLKLKVLSTHLAAKPQEWEKQDLQTQTRFNKALIQSGLSPLPFTTLELNGKSFTQEDAETFHKVIGNNPITPKLAKILYECHLPPQTKLYPPTELPPIDSTNACIEMLTDSQVLWHYKYIVANNFDFFPEKQMRGFIPRFYDLDLPPPSSLFVMEMSVPATTYQMTSVKTSYFFNFYLQNPSAWKKLTSNEQVLLNSLFNEYQYGVFPLVSPAVKKIPFMKKTTLSAYKAFYESNLDAFWNTKGRSFQ